MFSSSFNLLILLLFLIFLYYLKQKKVSLNIRIFGSLIFGVAYGFVLKFNPDNFFLNGIKNFLYFIGNGYLALLKMLIIPLIITSIMHALLNIGSRKTTAIKKISFLSCLILLIMTAISSLIGILIGNFFSVGKNLELSSLVSPPEKYLNNNLADTLLAMLPSNPIAAMAHENTIAIVLFAVFLGIAARKLSEEDHSKIEVLARLIQSAFLVVKNLTRTVLEITPYGILGLISLMILNQGTDLLFSMINFIAAMYTAMIGVLILHCIVLIIFKYNPFIYFKKASTLLSIAFLVRSSFGVLSIAEETLKNKFNTSQIVATFVPSIGATMGMNACAGIFPAMLVVMTQTILHQPITPQLILMVMFINAIASLGVSGIPGTAYVAATISLTSLNLPYGIVALVQGIDPIIDMGRTAVNVNGMMTTALTVERLQKIREDEENEEVTASST